MQINSPSKLVRFLIFAFLLVTSQSIARAITVYDESESGDLSNDNLSPTTINLVAGNNSIMGSTIFSPIDRDFFTVTIKDNQQLAAIILEAYETAEDQSFLAVETGNQISAINDASTFLGSTTFGANSGAQVGDNILDDLGIAALGGSGFSGPLGPGNYTFWLQENAANIIAYSLGFTVVPVPATFTLFVSSLGILGFLVIRRQGKSI